MELATLNLDTYKIVKLLQTKGYSEEQAEGFISAIQDITLSGVATKQDINDVKTEISELRHETLKFQIIQTLTIVGVMIALFQMF